MNPNVTYNSYGPPNASHSHHHPSYIPQTPHTSNPPSGVYRINPSNRSTSLGTMDNASVTNYNTNTNAGAGTPGTIATGAATPNGGGGGGGPRRQDTRNSYLSYASTNTPSWVNPSTMLETQAQSTPVMKVSGSRPLPDPSNYQGRNGVQQGYHQGYGGHGHGGYAQSAYSGGYGNHHGGHGARPSSGGYVITNVTEEEEEEYDDDEGEEGDERHHHHLQDGGNVERTNFAPQYQASYGYHGATAAGVNGGQNGYSMPVGMGGPNRMGVPMERVAPPATSQQNGATTRRRPLPIPGASQPLGGTGSAFSPKRKRSFVGGFLVGLRRLPKKVLRYGSKKKPHLDDDEIDGDEEFGMGGFGSGGSEHGLPQYNSKPGSSDAAHAKRSATLDDNTSGMPGALPLSSPPAHQQPQSATTMNDTKNPKTKRQRNPSFSLTPPSGETLGLQHMTNPEDQDYFNSPPPQLEEGEGDASVGGVEFPMPSLERNRTTTMMYHEEPAAPATQETHGTMATGEMTPSSERPPTVRQTSASASRMASNTTSGNITNERARAATPAPVIDTGVSPPENAQSPETAHPPPANDYLKMTTSPRTQTQATEVTEYTVRTSRSFTNDPSFSTELNPVFRFFHSFYHLPWISERSTVDYSPLAGFGGKSGGRGIVKKPGQTWYRKKGDADIGGITSNSLDLLAAGEGDTGSVLSPLGGWRRRVARRNTGDNAGSRHRHHHRSTRHGHGRGHGHGHSSNQGHGHGVPGRRRYRRRSTSTITFEEYHHQRNASPMIPSTYPFPFVSPPFPYFQAFPAMGGSGTPANADTSTAANQGTPAPAASGAAGGGGETQNETQKQGQAEPKSGGTPRGPRPWGSRAAIYPGGFAAYPPSPPMYPAPVWYPAGAGEGEVGRRQQAGLVYMPVMPGGYV